MGRPDGVFDPIGRKDLRRPLNLAVFVVHRARPSDQRIGPHSKTLPAESWGQGAGPRQESDSMFTRTRTFAATAAAFVVLGWAGQATAGLPNLPPYQPPPPPPFVPPPPPPVLPPPPVITPPPPIHSPPPPRASSPEPATLVLGLLGAGIGGLIARRNRLAK
jgi:hypothetical protein